jgi:NTE family protein
LGVAFVAALAACSTFRQPINGPLAGGAPHVDYRLGALKGDNSDELLILVSISGGGKRSSAFSYGVFKALNGARFDLGGRSRSLLSEVDLVSGVSGGTFTASYYALHREAMFRPKDEGCGFERDFLFTDYDADIMGMYLAPWNWGWMMSGEFGTNDNMARLYAERLFQIDCDAPRDDRPNGALFSDLHGKGAPLLMVGATDVAKGTFFTFTQDTFDLLCSDLSSFPVAWAVAASNGFPGLFSPVTLKSYREETNCNVTPVWLQDQTAKSQTAAAHYEARALLAQLAREYMDPKRTQYAHLVDGGVSDNLALRGLTNWSIAHRTPEYLEQLAKTRKILLISIDGQAARDPHLALTSTGPGALPVLGAVLNTTIDRYNVETMQVALSEISRLADNIRTARCMSLDVDCAKEKVFQAQRPEVYFSHLNLADDPNKERRERLQAIDTSLGLLEGHIQDTIDSGFSAAACLTPVGADARRNEGAYPGISDFARSLKAATPPCPIKGATP